MIQLPLWISQSQCNLVLQREPRANEWQQTLQKAWYASLIELVGCGITFSVQKWP